MARRVTVPRFFDAHLHVRDGDMMRAVVPETARYCSRALIMPNVPAIETGPQAQQPAAAVRCAAGNPTGDPAKFRPLMSIKLTHRTTPDTIGEAEHYGVVSAKLYPTGATTASHDGIRNPERLDAVFGAMSECGMVLCIHGEEPSSFVLDREADYLHHVRRITKRFPGLRVVLEHVTTAAAVDFVADAHANVAATVTPHHLVTTLDDVLGNGLRPHNFCYPVPKRWEDRHALQYAVLVRKDPKFFLGSDSAPHPRGAKESACGCAGVYSAPVVPAVLLDLHADGRYGYWEQSECVEWLANFTSRFGEAFYRLQPAGGEVTFEHTPWNVPDVAIVDAGTEVVPFRAGQQLAWRIARD